MPLYEYECRQCGKHFERIEHASAPPLKDCPLCGGELKRLLGVPALQFKGSGWYVTDYGKGNGRDDAHEKPSSGHEKPSAPASSKPEAKATSS
ncbi:MAG: zinc ribbon domain-containing protein [Acidobacteria bacterium]|nr:zinc ribbon domain-containing protein [Acidobacteriota bacterium]